MLNDSSARNEEELYVYSSMKSHLIGNSTIIKTFLDNNNKIFYSFLEQLPLLHRTTSYSFPCLLFLKFIIQTGITVEREIIMALYAKISLDWAFHDLTDKNQIIIICHFSPAEAIYLKKATNFPHIPKPLLISNPFFTEGINEKEIYFTEFNSISDEVISIRIKKF